MRTALIGSGLFIAGISEGMHVFAGHEALGTLAFNYPDFLVPFGFFTIFLGLVLYSEGTATQEIPTASSAG